MVSAHLTAGHRKGIKLVCINSELSSFVCAMIGVSVVESEASSSLSQENVHHGITGENHPEDLNHGPNERNPRADTAQPRAINARDDQTHNGPADYCLNASYANVQKHDDESVFEVSFHQRRPHACDKVEAAKQDDGPQNREPPNVVCVVKRRDLIEPF